MKKLVFLVFLLCGTGTLTMQAQCNNKLIETAAKKGGPGAVFIRDFKVKLQEGSIQLPSPVGRFSVLLNEGIHYRFTLANADVYEGKAVMQLFDKTNLLGSSIELETGVDNEAFDYTCEKTKVYQIVISFKEGKAGCAVGVMSMIEDQNNNDSIRFVEKEKRVIYAGIDNPLDISMPGHETDSLDVSISKGYINYIKGEYIARVDEPGHITITVVAKDKNGNITQTGSLNFEVRQMPLPRLTLAGKESGSISLRDIRLVNQLELIYPVEDKDYIFEITGFSVSPQINSIDGIKSSGELLTESQKRYISGLSPGSRFFITNIQLRGPDGKLYYPGPQEFVIE